MALNSKQQENQYHEGEKNSGRESKVPNGKHYQKV